MKLPAKGTVGEDEITAIMDGIRSVLDKGDASIIYREGFTDALTGMGIALHAYITMRDSLVESMEKAGGI